jgi:hypothetical protein
MIDREPTRTHRKRGRKPENAVLRNLRARASAFGPLQACLPCRNGASSPFASRYLGNPGFDDYSEDAFAQHLQARARIVQVVEASATGRRLFWFTRPEPGSVHR